jgi:6-phosphogluconolactonase
MDIEVKKFQKQDQFYEYAALLFQTSAAEAIYRKKEFNVVLSGGNTPKLFFKRLVSWRFGSKIDWQRVKIYIADERNVSHAHAESNFKMINENLISKMRIPKEHVFMIKHELDHKLAAENYETLLKSRFANNTGSFFDLAFLGMGNDGHTMSIFPEFVEAAKKENSWVIPTKSNHGITERVSMTFDLINKAENAVIMASGADKLR